jgi:signal transduction histidine kinase
LKRRETLSFFVLPFAAVAGLFLVFSALNRAAIRRGTEALVEEQLQASAEILKVDIGELLERGEPADGVLARYAGAENIYFLALLDGRGEILGWISRFEGYLPFSRAGLPASGSWVIGSPAGRIFNVLATFATGDGAEYRLYLGYSLARLEGLLADSRRKAWLLFGAVAAAGLVVFLGVLRTHRRYLAKAEEALAEREEKDRFKELSGFASGVAHEIKNPMNSLALLFDLLQKKAPPGMAGDVVLGREEVRKVAEIVDRFSEAARPLALRKSAVRLADLAEEIRAARAGPAGGGGAAVRVSVEEDVNVSADRSLLGRALDNLVRNAVESGPRSEVVIRVARRKRGAVLRVEDDGPGLPPGAEDRLFEPFFSTKSSGLGVGLYLARKIVEAHEGKLTAERRPEGGAAFTIEFQGKHP